MPTSALPKISALMGAYNYGRYIGEAIDSAMLQEYPEDLLELVIVDDGSTDNTAELVAGYVERFPGRIKLIRQANAGATAATNRALREVTGDLIALLDADDVWMPDKTIRQVEFMQRRPELGLVFSQMRVIDSDGATLQNHYGHREPMPPNDFARVVWENVAVQSSLLVETALFDPIPPEIPYADWWVALRASQFKHIDYLREDLVLYRWHGENITGGVGGAKALREAQKGIGFQRWVIRNFGLDELTSRLSPDEMAYVWTGLENQAQKGLLGLKSHFGTLTTVTAEDRAAAAVDAGQAEVALAEGDMQRACGLLLRARACDPYDAELRGRFHEVIGLANAAAQLPDPLEGSGSFIVLASAEFLLRDVAHLVAYADALRGISSATLLIDASAMEPERAASELQALVERAGLDEDDEISMVAMIGAIEPSQRFSVRRRTNAFYAQDDGSSGDGAPAFTPDSLGRLRELAERT
jgi:glycosyltransferase involved in cell wall biosynthesis